MSNYLDSQSSMDDAVTPWWCSPVAWDGYEAALNLKDGNGQRWDPALACLPGSWVGRLINAAHMLQAVTWHRANSTLPRQATIDWLLDHVNRNEGGYAADCERGDSIATNWSGPRGTTVLHWRFFWEYPVASRAGVLAHEVVHERSDHWCNKDCQSPFDWIFRDPVVPCYALPTCCTIGASCDVSFGGDNANTSHIRFNAQAVGTYWRDPTPGSTSLGVHGLGDGVCGYLPLLSPYARNHALFVAQQKLQGGFVFPDPEPWWPPEVRLQSGGTLPRPQLSDSPAEFMIDSINQARWPCGRVCNPDDVGSCDEAKQPANVARNEERRVACQAANDAVAAGTTPDQRASIQQAFDLEILFGSLRCVPGYGTAYLATHCDEHIAAVPADRGVGHLAAGWDLVDQPGIFDAGADLAVCKKKYCQSVFEPIWAEQSHTACFEWSDPRGCAVETCGDLSEISGRVGAQSKEYFAAVQCRRHYFENGGSPAEYGAQGQNPSGCEKQYRACKDQQAYEAWVAARSAGRCSLTSDAGGAAGLYHLGPLSSMASMTYDQFHAAHTAALIDHCVEELQTCEKVHNALVKAIAFWAREKPTPVSDLPPKPSWGDVAQRVWQAAEIALLDPVGRHPFTPAQAIRALSTIPEAQQALSRLVGQETYFAAFGTRQMEDVFGEAVCRRFSGAQLLPLRGLPPVQQEAFDSVVAAKTVRERLESSATADLFLRAERTLDQATLYGNVRSIMSASTPAEINAALDRLEAAAR